MIVGERCDPTKHMYRDGHKRTGFGKRPPTAKKGTTLPITFVYDATNDMEWNHSSYLQRHEGQV